MKRLLPLLMLLVCGHALAAASIVQNSGKQTVTNSSTNPTFTLSGVANHDTIIVLINYIDTSAASSIPASVADGGGAYTLDEQMKGNNTNGNHSSASIYSFFNAAAGVHALTLTRGAGATGAYWIYQVLEVAGLPTTNSKDTSSATNFGAGSGPVNVGGSTLTAVNGLAITLGMNAIANNTPAIYPPEVGISGSASSYIGLFTGASDFPSGGAGYLIPNSTPLFGADFGGIATSTAWAAIFVYYTPASVSFTHDGYRPAANGALVLPDGSTGGFLGCGSSAGQLVTPDGSTVYYYQGATADKGACGVN